MNMSRKSSYEKLNRIKALDVPKEFVRKGLALPSEEGPAPINSKFFMQILKEKIKEVVSSFYSIFSDFNYTIFIQEPDWSVIIKVVPKVLRECNDTDLKIKDNYISLHLNYLGFVEVGVNVLNDPLNYNFDLRDCKVEDISIRVKWFLEAMLILLEKEKKNSKPSITIGEAITQDLLTYEKSIKKEDLPNKLSSLLDIVKLSVEKTLGELNLSIPSNMFENVRKLIQMEDVMREAEQNYKSYIGQLKKQELILSQKEFSKIEDQVKGNTKFLSNHPVSIYLNLLGNEFISSQILDHIKESYVSEERYAWVNNYSPSDRPIFGMF